MALRNLGPLGMKWLKILHILLAILFLGGILSSFTLTLWLDLSAFDEVYVTYKNLLRISDNVVRYGAQGTLLVGIVYGMFTTWGFFKHTWLIVKWLIFTVQTVLGIFIVDHLMVANMALLESEGSAALRDPIFLYNHHFRQSIVVVQIVLTLVILMISGLKPWRSKSSNSKPAQRSTYRVAEGALMEMKQKSGNRAGSG